jgi:hypothetical protein
MKKVFLVFFVSLCFGVISVVLWANPSHAADACPVFPGDGYDNPDAFGVSGHGPALRYRDRGDGTFKDRKTRFLWEKKLAADGSDGGDCDEVAQADRSVHCVNNVYTWTDGGDGDFTNPDGTLFTVFLAELNDVAGGGANCFAGFCDWCIPNIKKLQSIVDYSTFNPASSVPGETAAPSYWSAATGAVSSGSAWGVDFFDGFVGLGIKGQRLPRPRCSSLPMIGHLVI